MYYKLPWDEAKTMPCILQHCHNSVLTVARLLHTSGTTGLDPELKWADWS